MNREDLAQLRDLAALVLADEPIVMIRTKRRTIVLSTREFKAVQTFCNLEECVVRFFAAPKRTTPYFVRVAHGKQKAPGA